MRTHLTECSAETLEALDFVDVTDEIQASVDSSGIRNGQVTIFAPDSSCSLIVNELESGLLSDIRAAVVRLASDNPSGRKSMIGSTSVVLPAVDGVLRLGTWQRVLLVELEGARTRSIVVQIVGE
jgi:secondary thiamine-phosphate synthase enzyme